MARTMKHKGLPARERAQVVTVRSHLPLAPFLLFAFALALRVSGVFQPAGMQLQEAYPLKIALQMSGAGGSAPTLDPNFFHYPSLIFYVYAFVIGVFRLVLSAMGLAGNNAAWAAYCATHTGPLFQLGAAVAAFFGAAIVLPVYALGKAAGGRNTGVLASLLVAANPFLIARTSMIDVDTPLMLLTAATLALAVTMGAMPRSRALAAGALAGLATSVKYPGAFVLTPVVLGVVGRARGTNSHRALMAIAAGAIGLAAFAVTSPFVFIDSARASQDLSAERAHLTLGHFGASGGSVWLFYVRSWITNVAGLAVGVIGPGALVALAIVRRSWWSILALGFVGPYAVCLCLWKLTADRYLLPLVPIATVAAAYCLIEAARRWQRRELPWTLVALLFVLSLSLDFGRWSALRRAAGPEPRIVSATWLAQHAPPGSMLVIEPYGPVVRSPLESRVPRPVSSESASTESTPRSPYYWLVPIPMFQVEPERTSPYYDPSLYGSADLWIVTGTVRDRYRADPSRFPIQVAFYDWLEKHWVRVATFQATGGTGSEIVVYKNPAVSRPFGDRVKPPMLPSVAMQRSHGNGGESAFYYALGLDYYGFGFPAEAAECFKVAGGFPTVAGGVTPAEIERAYFMSRNALSGDQVPPSPPPSPEHGREPGGP